MSNYCMCYNFCEKAGEKECNDRCLKNMELSYLLKNCGVPIKRQCIVPLVESKEDKNVIASIRKIAEEIVDVVDSGTNIVLYSEKTGNGKTTIAINLMLSYFNEIWAGNGFRNRGYFMYVPSYLNRCKDSISKFDDALTDLKKRVLSDDILILDDIGTSRPSEYDISILSTIINERLLAQKTIIVTTNCDRKLLSSMIGERMADRLWSTSLIFHLKADSFRGIM